MIKFDDIHPDIVPVLRENGIQEEDLFNHSSDLYIGCPNAAVARKIKEGGIWNAMSSTFIPQKGSEMEMYPRAVDIGFGYTSYFEHRKNQKSIYK